MLTWEAAQRQFAQCQWTDSIAIYIEIKQYQEQYLVDEEASVRMDTQLHAALQEHTSDMVCCITLGWGCYFLLWTQVSWSQVDAWIHQQNEQLPFSLAFGICFPQENDNLSTLLCKGMLAAHHTKDYLKYTTSLELYDPLLENAIYREIYLQKELEQAMIKGELQVYLQPKVRLSSRRICGAEALLRWQHQGEWIPLSDLMKTIQKNSFIRQVDQYVLFQILHLLSLCDKKKLPLYPISVNISLASFHNGDDYLRYLHQLQAQYHVSNNLLDFEISEDIVSCDSERLLTFMRHLHTLGYTMSMDDFGSGSASLTSLTYLPFTTIKLDRSFFSRGESEKGNHLLASVLTLFHDLHLTCVAEGIEDASYLSLLQAYGCDQIQGYYFYKPMSIPSYLTLLETDVNDLE